MIKVVGKYNSAVCFTDTLEESAHKQILALCDQVEFSDCKIRIMPDVHAGMGCTIGTTLTITDKVVPGMVGVDIGCGVEVTKLETSNIDYRVLDNLIKKEVPSGRNIRKSQHSLNAKIDLEKLNCKNKVKIERAKHSIGTLGGGNHFIEVGRDSQDSLYLVVHSGSRHLGKEVAEYYQNLAYLNLAGKSQIQIDEVIAKLKHEGKSHKIQETVNALKTQELVGSDLPKDLTYLNGTLLEAYLQDMKLVQQFAVLNRQAITEVIVKAMKFKVSATFTTIHNYIDTETMILRKGAVSAGKKEKLIIPINMKEGSLLCLGKGNENWNFSAPHGAGRLLSRAAALKQLDLAQYEKTMVGIYSSSISRKTLDEAPEAYKGIDEITKNIEPTVTIIDRIVPTYNFKAAD